MEHSQWVESAAQIEYLDVAVQYHRGALPLDGACVRNAKKDRRVAGVTLRTGGAHGIYTTAVLYELRYL